MNSDLETNSGADASSSRDESEEPVMSVVDVMGWKAPEAVDTGTMDDSPEEPAPANAYERWLSTGSSEDLFAVTEELRPTIGSALASMGGAGNPQLEARARVIAAKAVKSYNPEAGASLPTWVSNQLRQMVRDVRKSNGVIHVPDGVKMDAYAIYRAEEEFKDRNGREPTMDELADAAKMSVKRIRDVRRKMRPVSSGTAEDPDSGEKTEQSASVYETDYSRDALDYVYNDSDRLDKKIIEYTTGYNGFPPKDNKAIMAELKLTPVQLTRRKARLSLRIRDIISDLEAVQG